MTAVAIKQFYRGSIYVDNMRLEIFETRSLLDGRFRRVKNGVLVTKTRPKRKGLASHNEM